MSTYINTNTTAYMASLNLNANTNAESTDIERLSTGLKINSAADDPAGLVMTENESAQLAGLNQATSNTNNAINLTQTAEGALNQVQTLLISMRQLAVAASQTGTNNSTDLAADQAQIASAIQSINNISSTTQFNNSNLLDGTASSTSTTSPGSAVLSPTASTTSLLAQGSWSSALTGSAVTVTGATAATDTSQVVTGMTTALSSFSGSLTIGTTAYSLGGTSVSLASLNTAIASSGYVATVAANKLVLTGTTAATSGASASAVSIAGVTAYAAVAGQTTGGTALTDGFVQGVNGFATINSINSTGVTNSGTESVYSFANGAQIEVATPAIAATAATVGYITTTAGKTTTGASLQFQLGANEGQNIALSIQSTAAAQLGTGTAAYTNSAGVSTNPATTNVSGVNVTTFQGAQDAIAVLDQAINQISTVRANLGAFQTNVLQSNVTSLGVSTTNLQATQATVEDTDMASQVVDYTKNSILVSAATSALTYANQEPQDILKLLQ